MGLIQLVLLCWLSGPVPPDHEGLMGLLALLSKGWSLKQLPLIVPLVPNEKEERFPWVSLCISESLKLSEGDNNVLG